MPFVQENIEKLQIKFVLSYLFAKQYNFTKEQGEAFYNAFVNHVIILPENINDEFLYSFSFMEHGYEFAIMLSKDCSGLFDVRAYKK